MSRRPGQRATEGMAVTPSVAWATEVGSGWSRGPSGPDADSVNIRRGVRAPTERTVPVPDALTAVTSDARSGPEYA